LISLVDFIKTIRPNTFALSQLPYKIPETDLCKPAKWEIETQLFKANRPYANLLIANVEEISPHEIKITFSFRDKKENFSGNALIENGNLKIEKIQKIL
jgi:hypothetical protein